MQILRLLVLTWSIFALGCATTKKYQQSLDGWIGKNADELIISWGAPNQTYALSNGKTLTYYRSKGASGALIYGTVVTKNKYCQTNFNTDSVNIIRSYTFNGTSCKL